MVVRDLEAQAIDAYNTVPDEESELFYIIYTAALEVLENLSIPGSSQHDEFNTQ